MKKQLPHLILASIVLFLNTITGQISNATSNVQNLPFTAHEREEILDKLLPESEIVSIIREQEKKSGISKDDEIYFMKFTMPDLRILRNKLIEGYAKKIENKTDMVQVYKTALSDKALEFTKKRTLIIDQIDNPLRYSGYNFRGQNPSDNIMTPGQPCTNEGFENGDFTAWSGSWGEEYCSSSFLGLCVSYAGENNPNLTAGLNIGAVNSTNSMHTVVTAGADGTVPINKVRPGGGTYAMRLNDKDYDDYSAARLIQTFLVTPANVNFTYYYAVVLENGGHTLPEQPYFRIRMYDQNGASITCAAFDVDATSAGTIGGFQTQGLFSYKDWSAVFVPLQAYVGQNVTIEFVVNDCTQGGHLGYAYVDADCQPFEIISQQPQVCNGMTNVLTAPAGAASYTWTASGGGNIVSGGNTNAATVNTAGSYSVTMTAYGSGCSYTLDTVLLGAPSSPTANFTSDVPCIGSASTFTDATTGGATSWNWNFGDGGTSTNQNPSYTYATPGTYTVTLTASNGCNSTYSTTVNVPAGSTAAFTANPVCEGSVMNFTNTSTAPAGSTFNWSFGDTQTISNSGGNVTHSYSGANTYNVTLQITAPGGCNGTVTQAVTVNPNPVPAFTSNAVCATNGTQFTNTSPAVPAITTWSWDFTNDGTADNNTTAPSFTYPAAGTYTASLTATSAAGCIGTYTSAVTVNPNPVASFTASTECVNDPTSFNSSGSSIAAPDNIAFYNWTFGDGNSASGASPTYTYTTCGTYTANLVVVSNNNCTNNTNVMITVKCRPTVTVPTNTVVCPATAIPGTNFTSNPGGATYTWTNSDINIGLTSSGIGDIAGFNTTNAGSTQLNGVITVTPTLAGCVGTPTSYTVGVYPTPPAPGTTDVNYCLNDITVPLIATPSAGGSLLWWGTAANGGTSSTTSPTPSSATIGTTTYYVSQTVNSCEGPRAPLNVIVNTLPSIVDPPDTVICPGILVPSRNFTSTPAGATLNWTSTNTGIGLGASGTGAVPSFTSINNGTSSVNTSVTVVPNLGTCVGAPITYIITVDPKPVAVVPANSEACPGDNMTGFQFSSIPSNAATNYTWSHTNANIGLSQGAGAAATTSFTNNFTATNTASTFIRSDFTLITELNGCYSDPVSFTFTVNPLPTPLFTASHTCEGEATTFNSLSTIGSGSVVNYNWDFDNNGTYEVSNGTGNPTYTLSGSGTQTVTMQANSDKNCHASVTQTFYIHPKPVPTLTVDVPAGCPDHTVQMAAGVTAASVDHPNSIVSWAWDVQTNNSIDFANNYPLGSQTDTIGYTYTNPSPVASQLYQVTITATTDQGCIGTLVSAPNFITVYAHPVADFSYGPSDPEPNVQYPLVAFYDQSAGATSWHWSFNDPYSIPAANQSNLQNPQHYYESYEAETYDVQLVINNGQCWDSIVKPIIIKPDWTFYIPNAFSPNGDGINDGFRGTGVGIEDYTLMIFDRWGEMIWMSNDLDKEWNGVVAGKSKLVQQDVYVWKVKFKDGKKTKHHMEGTVTVVR